MQILNRIRRALAAQLQAALAETPTPAEDALDAVQARLARLEQALAEAHAHRRRLELEGADAAALEIERAWQAELLAAAAALTRQRATLRDALAAAERHRARLAWREELARTAPALAQEVEAALHRADALAARDAWRRDRDAADA